MARTLLLVEDSPTQAAKIRFNLEAKSFSVVVAGNGQNALKCARDEQNRPTLIILDYNLPDYKGVEVCRMLKADAATKSIPVIMYSAEHGLRTMSEAYNAGADYYVVKEAEGAGGNGLELVIEATMAKLARRQRVA
ncbi:MAG: response regulator [Chloroflexota bacterium]|nr:response regulator [Chloroflexota bacterium]